MLMDIYEQFRAFTDANLILCLIPMLLILKALEIRYKKRFPAKQILNLIGWMIVIYAFLNLVYFVVGLIIMPDEFAIINRATGPYAVAYWLMLILSTLFPFILLAEKYRHRFWLVLLIAFCVKIGTYFEHIVLLTTSVHRDYPINTRPVELLSFWIDGITIASFQALLWLCILYGIVRIFDRKKIAG